MKYIRTVGVWGFVYMLCTSYESLAQDNHPFVLDVPYVPTPDIVVDRMLQLAEVTAEDILYDLGSGDGRIPIAAAKRLGTTAVGIDLNPERVREAKANAENAQVTDKVEFIEGNIFDIDFTDATVLCLYLFPEVNMRLRPTILRMDPGTRVISHNYDMGDWKPERVEKITAPSGTEHTLYLWRVPPNGKIEIID